MQRTQNQREQNDLAEQLCAFDNPRNATTTSVLARIFQRKHEDNTVGNLFPLADDKVDMVIGTTWISYKTFTFLSLLSQNQCMCKSHSHCEKKKIGHARRKRGETMNQNFDYTTVPAFDAIRGHRSACLLEQGMIS